MSINSEFVSAEDAAEILASSTVTEDISFCAMRIRRLRSADREVVLVEGGLGEYAVISH